MNVHSPFFIDHLESTTATCHFKSLGLLLCIQEILGLNNLNPESSCPDLTFYQCHNFHTTGINVLKL